MVLKILSVLFVISFVMSTLAEIIRNEVKETYKNDILSQTLKSVIQFSQDFLQQYQGVHTDSKL